MTAIRRGLAFTALTALTTLTPAGLAFAAQGASIQNPTTGQPGASSGVTCFSGPATGSAPGKSMSSPGSVFDPDGQSGTVYAGNDGTSSLAHANSTAAVSQYDVACLQVTSR